MTRMLKLVAAMNISGAESDMETELPDNWDDLTKEEQDEWAGEALEVHKQNCDTSYWEVVGD